MPNITENVKWCKATSPYHYLKSKRKKKRLEEWVPKYTRLLDYLKHSEKQDLYKSWRPKGVQDPLEGAFTKSKLFEDNSETPFASLTQLAVAVIVQIIVTGTAGALLRQAGVNYAVFYHFAITD